MPTEGQQGRLYRGALGRLLCRIGHHNYRWSVTMTEPQLNWRECVRCGHVEDEYRDQYEKHQRFTAQEEPSE